MSRAEGRPAQDSCDATGNCPPESHTATEDSHHAIAATHRDAEGGLSRFWKSTTSVLQSTYSTAKNTVYNTLVEPTVDRVKTVVREQFFGLIEWLGSQVFSPDQPLGKFVRAVGTTALSMTLALLCVLFSYIFLRYFSLLFVLAFNCGVFLLHHFYGPEWLFVQLEWVCRWIYWVLMLAIAHPYISAALILLLFLGNFLMQLYEWEEQRSRKRQIDRIDSNLVDVKDAILDMERRLERRLRRIERHLGVEEQSDGESD
eukprot:Em0018g308a